MCRVGATLDLTEDWQEVPSGMVVEGGSGLEVRFDQVTNRTYARRVAQQRPPDWCTEPEPDYIDEPISW